MKSRSYRVGRPFEGISFGAAFVLDDAAKELGHLAGDLSPGNLPLYLPGQIQAVLTSGKN